MAALEFFDSAMGAVTAVYSVVSENKKLSRELDELEDDLRALSAALVDLPLTPPQRSRVLQTAKAAEACLSNVRSRRRQGLGVFRHGSLGEEVAAVSERTKRVLNMLLARERVVSALTNRTRGHGLKGSSSSSSSRGGGPFGSILHIGKPEEDEGREDEENQLFYYPDQFDAMTFLTHSETKHFWCEHVGRSVRKLPWSDFLESFFYEYDIGSDSHSAIVFSASDVKALREALCPTGDSVSVFALSKFCGTASLLTTSLRIVKASQFDCFDEAEKIILEALAQVQGTGLLYHKQCGNVTCLQNVCKAWEAIYKLLKEQPLDWCSGEGGAPTKFAAAIAPHLASLPERPPLAPLNPGSNSTAAMDTYTWRLVYLMQFCLITDFCRGPLRMPESVRPAIDKMISSAVEAGKKAFNSNDVKRCERIYRSTCADILAKHAHTCNGVCRLQGCRGETNPFLVGMQQMLVLTDPSDSGLALLAAIIAKGEAEEVNERLGAADRAWLLRRSMDFLTVMKIVRD